jgi:hypothetical protein
MPGNGSMLSFRILRVNYLLKADGKLWEWINYSG